MRFHTPFNRTSMELKHSFEVVSYGCIAATFNRTSMELKPTPYAFQVLLEASLLLIEPVWN